MEVSIENKDKSWTRDTCVFHPDRKTGEIIYFIDNKIVRTGYKHPWKCESCVIEDPYE